MPTPSYELLANKAADRRLLEYHGRFEEARKRDAANRVDRTDKNQWGVLIAWLLSESKNLDEESRHRMFDHLAGCAREMNTASRRL